MMVNNILNEINIKTQLFYEGNLNHSADFERIASYNKEEFEKL